MARDVYVREFVHPEDTRFVAAEVAKALTIPERCYFVQFEHRIIRRDGEVRTIVVRINVLKDATGKIVKWFGANQDITERKAMEEDLRNSREILSLAAELAHFGPW
jgi:PAS domain S-box-containing protein